ncbi:serine hydrolase domain-containing protein, partial [Ferruginibacter sp.]
HTLIIVYLFSIVLNSCNPATQKANAGQADSAHLSGLLPKPTTIAPAEVARLRSACEQWFDSSLLYKNFNGSILVAKGGNIVFEKYTGTGHIPGNDLLTDSTPLQIASTSKTFTAMAVLKLWQEGKLNIDDEFSKYFTTFNYPGVTIRSLLSHRSGLPNYLHFMENLGWNKKQMASNQDVYDFLVNRKAELVDISAPNTHFTYCNTNFVLLAMLVEKVSGIKFPAYLQQNFFTPLGMKHSFVYTAFDSIKVNYSYDWRGTPIALNEADGSYGDKNVYTTVRDLLIWDRALSTNALFTKETLAQAYAPYSNEKPGVRNYGLGWRMNIYPNGKKMIYHNGWWHGNRAVFIRLLEEDATIILISNKDFRSIYHAKILANLFGDYYTGEEEEESENSKTPDSSPGKKADAAPAPVLSKKNARLQQLFKDKNKVTTHK